MPFIRRLLTHEPEPSFGKITTPHEFYVSKGELQHGDVVLDPFVTDFNSPKYIRDEVLKALAAQYPKEFGAALEKRGLKVETPGAEDDADTDDDADDDDDGSLERAAQQAAEVVSLAAEEAVAAIAKIDDADVLAAIRELEEARDKPRKSVIAALDATEA